LSPVLAAAAPLFAVAFVVGGASVTWLEILAVALSVAMVVCNIRVNVVGWPLAIASSLRNLLRLW
jgi:nicotinamide mononucleotide transporter